MERRLILAMVLSLGILYLWNVVINPPPPPSEQQQAEQQQQKKPEKLELPDTDVLDSGSKGQHVDMMPDLEEQKRQQALKEEAEVLAEKADAENTTDENQEAAEEKPVEIKPEVKPEVKPEEKLVTIDTDEFVATFTTYGAKLKSFVLKNEKYSHLVSRGEEEVREQVDIVTSKENKNLPYALVMDEANFKYDPGQPYKVEARTDTSVTFKTTTPQGVVIKKHFELEHDYLFKLDLTVENNAKATASFFPIIAMVGIQDEANVQSGMFGSMPMNLLIPKAFMDMEIWEETSPRELEAPIVMKGNIIWTALDDRYFLLSLLPPEGKRSQISIKNVSVPLKFDNGDESTRNILAITHSMEKQNVSPGETRTLNYQAYIGPKEYDILSSAGSYLNEAIDFWVLGFLAKPMLWVLQKSYNVIPNWGIAIIILTILIKIVLYPLTRKSFQSMQKMKELKPKIDALKEKIGDDKQEMNKQMMELYKTEGVNPLGGCLPMLLQMPVYIALYKMLQNAVELYNASFIPGWLDNLVLPDPYYILPVGLSALMFVQQKLTPTPDSQQQKMMLYMMPAMMFFFMLMLPSGLVLYILANTVMTIIQQWLIAKKAEKEKAAA